MISLRNQGIHSRKEIASPSNTVAIEVLGIFRCASYIGLKM